MAEAAVRPSPPCQPIDLPVQVARAVERSSVYVVLLDGGGRIVWSNPAFQSAVGKGAGAAGDLFQRFLDEESAQLVSDVGLVRSSEQAGFGLGFSTPMGRRVVRFQFFSTEDGSIAGVGTDRTEEVELIEQMSALSEDLHRELDRSAALQEELERLATIDYLTGTFNRRQFESLLKEEWSRSFRYGSRFALFLIDIDHFKQVNDVYGHQAGDEVLRAVAEQLRESLREDDRVARYGGEEFAVIALGATTTNARELGERLRHRIQTAALPGGVTGVTITIGIAASDSPKPAQTHLELIAQADAALYRGKRNGRNRVEVHSGG